MNPLREAPRAGCCSDDDDDAIDAASTGLLLTTRCCCNAGVGFWARRCRASGSAPGSLMWKILGSWAPLGPVLDCRWRGPRKGAEEGEGRGSRAMAETCRSMSISWTSDLRSEIASRVWACS